MSRETEFLIFIAVVAVTNLITFIAVWDYWHRKHTLLLQERANERRTTENSMVNVRLKEMVYGNVTMGDIKTDR